MKKTHQQYAADILLLCKAIERVPFIFTNVFGIPRGGFLPAIEVAQYFNKPVITDPSEITIDTLIVDDLADSGATLAKFKANRKAVVYKKMCCKANDIIYAVEIPAREWIELPDEKGDTLEDNIRRVFQFIGEDPNRPGLKDTPDRIVRMCREIFRGYDPSQKPKITTFDNGQDGLTCDEIVFDTGDFYSLCEHHMRTFFGQYYFAYIPNPKGKILGISKIGRVVDYCSARLQIQERLGHDIIAMLEEALGEENPPVAMAIVMKGRHMCKESRGARKKGVMTSAVLTGQFKTDAALRNEFYHLIETAERGLR